MESVQFFANQWASMSQSYDVCISPPPEESASGFSRNSFQEQLVLPADASQQIVLELEEKKRNCVESDDRPSLAQKSEGLARRPRPISKASLASAPEEDEERHPYLRQWGKRHKQPLVSFSMPSFCFASWSSLVFTMDFRCYHHFQI